jgi:hypothetical protein
MWATVDYALANGPRVLLESKRFTPNKALRQVVVRAEAADDAGGVQQLAQLPCRRHAD